MHAFSTFTTTAGDRATFNRRDVLRAMAGAGFLAITLGQSGQRASAQVEAENHTSQDYVVTDDLNLRTGPSTSHSIITVMPRGSIIALDGREENGFVAVTYQGRAGWAHHDYIRPADGSGDPVIIGAARATTYVNLRSGPGTSYQVLRVVPEGAWVEVSDTIQAGFRYVIYDGQAGWMYDEYLSWASDGGDGGETFTTTADLNLRAEPSLSARIHLVMPEGSRVTAGDRWANGFREVTYQGTTGWAHTDFLN